MEKGDVERCRCGGWSALVWRAAAGWWTREDVGVGIGVGAEGSGGAADVGAIAVGAEVVQRLASQIQLLSHWLRGML